MLEIASEMAGKSKSNGGNTTIALKTYLDDKNDLVYKVLIVKDFIVIEESPEFRRKHDAVMYYDMLAENYGL